MSEDPDVLAEEEENIENGAEIRLAMNSIPLDKASVITKKYEELCCSSVV